MSWVLFLDESGHDHKIIPYEVRGGIALHTSKLLDFVLKWHRLEQMAFGVTLSDYKIEVKGAKLLEKKRFIWAQQEAEMNEETRRTLCRRFLTKGLEKKCPTRHEFTAYGQASLLMVRFIYRLLQEIDAVLFASVIPNDLREPETKEAKEFLRKDHVFLLERFYYFLEEKGEDGILVMDEAEKVGDRRFVRKLQDYFLKTSNGRKEQAELRLLPSSCHRI